jgi:hypothetical protein
MVASVYFLVHKSKPLFKIGVSVDLKGRLRSMKRDRFDIEKSCVLQLGNINDAYTVEQHLQKNLKTKRVNVREGVDGDTEFFESSVIDAAISMAMQFANCLPNGPKATLVTAEQALSESNVSMTFYMQPEDRRVLKQLAAEKDTTIEDLGRVALNMLLTHYQKPRLV